MTIRWRILLELLKTSAALHRACGNTVVQITQDSRIQPDSAFHLAFKQKFQDASPLDAFLRDAARRMLRQAIDEEVQEFLAEMIIIAMNWE